MPASSLGGFIWYDLLTSDTQAAIGFYEQVMGWTSTPSPGSGPDYTIFTSSQGMIGGVGQLPEQAKKQGAPPHWMAAVKVEDVDVSVAAAQKLGARVYLEAKDYPGAGRVAVIGDPQGAVIKLFAPTNAMAQHDTQQHGEFVWHELLAADHETAFAFYRQLFGWKKSSDFDMGAMGKYLLFGNGGADLGGMFTKPKEVPAPMWMYYVEVADLDAALERAKAKGARVLAGPMSVPGGARIVQLADPQGAMFALHEAVKSEAAKS